MMTREGLSPSLMINQFWLHLSQVTGHGSVTANLEDPQIRIYMAVVSKLHACNFEVTGLFYATYPLFSYYFFWFPNYVLRFSVDSKLPTGSFEVTDRQFRSYRPVVLKLPARSFETTTRQLRNYDHSFETTGHQIRN